ncbi:MAG: hypothetical protein PSV35_07100, partial [bacterium]|nr:hypothetical protein [bacterium]
HLVLTHLLNHVRQKGLSLTDNLVTTYPWFYFDSYSISSASPSLFSNLWGFVSSLVSSKPVQVELLEKQMRSIHFAKSTSLPTEADIKTIMSVLADPLSNSKKVRLDFIDAEMDKGCVITFQDAAYRPLNIEERELTVHFLDKYLKVNFKPQNIVLCKKLFNECIAVSAEGLSQKTRLETLLKLLARIDNKPYYNDLGQVLGLLIERSKSRKNQQRYYSLEQLTGWLESLIDPNKLEAQHYPINILKEILNHYDESKSLEDSSTFLNNNLNKLTPSIKPIHIVEGIAEIVQSDLPGQYKHILAKLSLDLREDDNFVSKAKKIIHKLHENKADPRWIKGVATIIGYVTESPNLLFKEHRYAIIDRLGLSMEEAGLANYPYDPHLAELWQTSQIKLIEIMESNQASLSADDLDLFGIDGYSNYVLSSIILILSLEKLDLEKNKEQLAELKQMLIWRSIRNLEDLALYCSKLPVPSIQLVIKLLDPYKFTGVSDLIHQFETVEQATKQNGEAKRHYSITPPDRVGLLRVLNGFKRKGHGVIEDNEQKKIIKFIILLKQLQPSS